MAGGVGGEGGGGAGQGGTVCRTAAPCADMHLGCSHVMHPELGISVTVSTNYSGCCLYRRDSYLLWVRDGTLDYFRS